MMSNSSVTAPIGKRVLLFIAEAIISSLFAWLVPVLSFLVFIYFKSNISYSDLILSIISVLSASFLAVPSSIGIRYLQMALPSLPRAQRLLQIAWFLLLGLLWRLMTTASLALIGVPSVGMGGEARRIPFPIVAFTAVLFYATDLLREQLAIFRRKRHIQGLRESDLRRREAFQLLPKSYSIDNRLDVFGVIDRLGVVQAENQVSGSLLSRIRAVLRPARSALVLQQIRRDLAVLADPRYNIPMPLPIAIGLLEQDARIYENTGNKSIKITIAPAHTFPETMTVEPAILRSAAIFAVEYTLYRSKGPAVVEITYQSSPKPCVQIATNVRAGDLWFSLDRNRAAQMAKLNLVETANRFVDRGTRFEIVDDVLGNIAVLVWTRQVTCDDESIWEDVAIVLGDRAQTLPRVDRSHGANRIYLEGDLVHKVQILGAPSTKALTLAEEYQVLERLRGIEGLPQVVGYQEFSAFAVLSCKRIEGTPVDEYLQHSEFSRRVWFRTVAELSAILSAIHRRGVVHRDLRPDNILIGKHGEVYLLDFDQAVVGALSAEETDMGSHSMGSAAVCVSFRHLITLLGLESDYKSVVLELEEAWKLAAQSNASSPGREVAYYNWSFGYTDFPGERDWQARWDLMYAPLRSILPGSCVLDLGCNQGLTSVYCMLYGAESVTGVDHEPDVLAAARKLADVSGVPMTLLQGDLDSPQFVSSNLQTQTYDLVIALSVIHWLRNPDPVLAVLSAATHILYEGHRAYSVEVTFLHGLGFDNIRLLGYCERLRPLFLASR